MIVKYDELKTDYERLEKDIIDTLGFQSSWVEEGDRLKIKVKEVEELERKLEELEELLDDSLFHDCE